MTEELGTYKGEEKVVDILAHMLCHVQSDSSHWNVRS